MHVSFNSEALAEAEEATHWYRDNGGSSPSRAFTQELRRVVRLAAEQPGVGNAGCTERFVCISSVSHTYWFLKFRAHPSE